MTTHDETVLAAHLGMTRLAESLTAAIDPACPGELQWVNVGDGIMQAVGCTHCNIFKPAPPRPERWPKLAAQLIDLYPPTIDGPLTRLRKTGVIRFPNPKGATMTESPAEQVARLAAETEGAKLYYACDNCEFVLWSGDGTEGDTGTQCGHDPQGIIGPLYYFPPAKPAPPTSRETLAANVKRLREAKGWTVNDLSRESEWNRMYVVDVENENHAVSLDFIDALAKALDTTPAALLTPETTT